MKINAVVMQNVFTFLSCIFIYHACCQIQSFETVEGEMITLISGEVVASVALYYYVNYTW